MAAGTNTGRAQLPSVRTVRMNRNCRAVVAFPKGLGGMRRNARGGSLNSGRPAEPIYGPRRMTATNPKAMAIRNLRWWIGGMLFASTVINYLDRQTLSNLAPYLKKEYGWTNTDYANLVIAFRLAYSVGQTLCGKLLDRIGTRRGLTISVLFYSVVSMLTSLATGWQSFAGFRFLLGLGESANWPAATKAVSEWFPKRERGLATALFDSGSSIGGALAPFVIIPIYLHWGWRPAFVIPGILGFLWLIVWQWLYHPPEAHPRVSAEERAMIEQDKRESAPKQGAPRPRWLDL